MNSALSLKGAISNYIGVSHNKVITLNHWTQEGQCLTEGGDTPQDYIPCLGSWGWELLLRWFPSAAPSSFPCTQGAGAAAGAGGGMPSASSSCSSYLAAAAFVAAASALRIPPSSSSSSPCIRSWCWSLCCGAMARTNFPLDLRLCSSVAAASALRIPLGSWSCYSYQKKFRKP